jgi:hypothetical protein
MFGSTDKDISQLLEGDADSMVFDDLEILEEYLDGVVLPPLVVAVPVEEEQGWPDQDGIADELAVSAPLEIVEEAPATTFTTSTMAEIYVSQGFIQRAIDIYEEMLTESPLNEGIIQRLSELQDLLKDSLQGSALDESTVLAAPLEPPPVESVNPKGVVETLETWLDNINRRR